ncbi:MAG: GNAT family N-acetyltransferase [Gaiellaceae bacterium]
MSGLELVPFSDDHLEDAAGLLAARHARDRRAEPLLPERYEDPAEALEEVENAWHEESASGTAALRGGRLAGYVLGAPRDPGIWGENVWVDLAGHVVEEPEDARDLYGHAAARWVEEGRTRHYVLLPADTPLVDAWFRLGFGQQQAHGYREVPERTDVRVPEGCEIRKPTEADVDALLEVELALPAHQRLAPVFSARPLPTEDEIRREWAETLAGSSDEEVLICTRDGRPVACWGFVSAERSSHHRGPGRPDNSCYLAFAATLPASRGAGVGVALTDAGFAWATGQGYRAMVTDWRVTNLLASRFWPRRGFRPAVLRLYRSIP